MDQNTIQSNSEHVATSQSVNLDGQFCSADQIFNGIVLNNIDTVSQNSCDLSNNTSNCQSLDINEGKGICYHERTSSCESTASSLSCSSYNSSNASGILLSVSSLGPDSSHNCDTLLMNKVCPIDPLDNSNTPIIKPDTVDNVNNCNNKQEDSRKSKELIDFSVIKLRGKNILLHKHDSVKMGQSANTTSSDLTQNGDTLKIFLDDDQELKYWINDERKVGETKLYSLEKSNVGKYIVKVGSKVIPVATNLVISLATA